jgi:cell division protein FtsX
MLLDFYKQQLSLQIKIDETFNMICMIDDSCKNKLSEYLDTIKELHTTTCMSIEESCDYIVNKKLKGEYIVCGKIKL